MTTQPHSIHVHNGIHYSVNSDGRCDWHLCTHNVYDSFDEPEQVIIMDPQTHAPYSVVGDLVIIFGQTTRSACGKRIPTKLLVERGEQSCPECAIQIAKNREDIESLEQAARDLGLME